MSVLKRLLENGCLIYGLFLLWLGIVVGIPCIIFDTKQVGITSCIAVSIGMYTMAISGEAKEHTFKKDFSYTYSHFWMFLAYAVGGMFTIGFGDIDYEGIKSLGKSIVFYAVLPVPVFFIEGFVNDRIKKKKRMEQRIQRLYQVACSHQNLKMYFQGKVDRIEVEYKILYRSFAGVVNKEGSFTKNKEDVANFYIECPNPECTSGYIDLRTEVLNAVEEWETMVSGVTTCCGKTAPDHPNQKCDVQIEYSIQIQYSQL